MTYANFPNLFSPVRLGRLELKNRLIMAPMATEYANHEGAVTDQLVAYYERRAAGGVGMIMVEPAYVERRGNTMLNHLGLDRDELIPGCRRITEAVHRHGARVFLQLLHGGALSRTCVTGSKPVAPSRVPTRRSYEIPKELTVNEIKEIVIAFGETARRAEEAGFDGVEVHACHSCLLSQFLSPAFNKRKDSYGGDVQGRTRIVLEIIEECGKKTGKNFPVTVRINGEEPYSNGNQLSDAIEISLILQNVSAALSITSPDSIGLVLTERGKLIPLAGAIKKEVRVPVIAGGAVIDPEYAEQILRDRQADLISMGRPFLADPDLPNKAAKGQLDTLRQCVLCHMCRQRDIRPQVVCLYNYETGRESLEKHKITPAGRAKRVMVIGAGPGGMEAARVVALRGHQVILYEKEKQVGGQLRLAGLSPSKNYINKVTEYLSRQVRGLDVTLKLGTLVTAELVAREKPDVAIVATGSIPKRIEYPTVEYRNETLDLVTAQDVLAGVAEVGESVLVVGAGAVGAETAEVLAEQGKGVTLIDEIETIAADLEEVMRNLLLERLSKANVVIYRSTTVKRILGKEVVLDRPIIVDASLRLNEQVLQGIDTIVFAVGGIPNAAIAEEIKAKVQEVYVIGDAKGTRTALEAIHEGSRIARLV